MSHRFASAASLVALVAGHGMMTLPASRNGGTLDKAGVTNQHDEAWDTASWFTTGLLTNEASVPYETNCDDAYATVITCKECSLMVKQEHQILCRNTPWRAPGLAKVVNPCGCAAASRGNPHGCTPGDKRQTQSLGTQLPKTQRERWTAGGTANVAFTSTANHGGGYAYRLCPAGAEQTEECFQNHHLQFVGGNSIVQWTTGKKRKIAALTLSSGTHPANSQWRAIRIPGCGGLVGMFAKNSSHDFCNPPLLPTQGIKFPPVKYHGDKLCSESYWDFSIMDKVAVPNLPSGGYTLSWRWDTEINPQVWQNCADIEIVGGTMNQSLSRGDFAV